MPEYPDIELYLHALAPRVSGQPLTRIRLASPFLVRSIDPPLETCAGRRVIGLRRLGKRVVFELEAEYFLIIHLMIAGRFRWREVGAKVPGKVGLAALDFPSGTLLLTEAGSQRQASLHAVRGAAALAAHDPGGADVFTLTLDEFDRQLRRENHTLKRALTDPRLFSGIGNAYSDEILLAARLSPLQLTSRLEPSAVARLFDITRTVLRAWKDRLIARDGRGLPREGDGLSGRYGRARPVWPPVSRCAGRRFSGSGTPATRPITARPARPAGASSPTAACRAC